MSNIIEKYNMPFEYAGIFMNLIIALQYLRLWYQPEFSDTEKIYAFAVLMAFEFILLHSGLFMAFVPKKMSLFLLVPFYGCFAWLFSKSMPDNTILIIYSMVVLNRMRFAFADVSPSIKGKALLTSLLGFAAYIVAITLCVFTNSIFGELGLTPEFLEQSGYLDNLNSSGNFVEQPHIAMSFGFFYYSFLTIIETLLLNKTTKKKTVNYRHAT